jgi:hypothetical protein
MPLLKPIAVTIFEGNISAGFTPHTSTSLEQHRVKAIPCKGLVQKIRMSLSKKGREMNSMVEKACLRKKKKNTRNRCYQERVER